MKQSGKKTKRGQLKRSNSYIRKNMYKTINQYESQLIRRPKESGFYQRQVERELITWIGSSAVCGSAKGCIINAKGMLDVTKRSEVHGIC